LLTADDELNQETLFIISKQEPRASHSTGEDSAFLSKNEADAKTILFTDDEELRATRIMSTPSSREEFDELPKDRAPIDTPTIIKPSRTSSQSKERPTSKRQDFQKKKGFRAFGNS
jgi:hypothetical protein